MLSLSIIKLLTNSENADMCINFISISVIKHPDQKQLRQEKAYFGLQVPRNKRPSWHGMKAECSTHGNWNRSLRAHTLKHKHEANNS